MTETAQETPAVHRASHMDTIPEDVKQRVTSLQELQVQHDELEKKFREEKLALILKYQELYEPLYAKRSTIVTGSEEVVAPDAAQGVPDFWLLAMKTNELVAAHITPRDEGALKYLRDIKAFYTQEPKGFKLEFYFAENPYFTNSLLKKEYHMVDDDEPILESVKGTEINWKEGKKLTVKLMKKKPKKNAPDAPPETKTVECESFFNFFSPPRIPDDDEDVDQDDVEELQDLMEQDYDIGATIRDKIIAHAVSWYTGEAAEEEDILEGLDDIEEEDDDEYDSDEEEDSDEVEEDEEPNSAPAN